MRNELFEAKLSSGNLNENVISTLICSYLQSIGWTIFDQPSGALAFKMYDTAVGMREAQVYLPGDQYSWKLSGLYESKGQNILSTSSVFIPTDFTAHQLQDLCVKFIQNVESAIADSYAVRLLTLN